MLAKLDNLGPFQMFFTLSCADMRWDENFAAILLDRGFEIKYRLVNDEEGNWETEVEGRIVNGQWKKLKQFIEEVPLPYHHYCRTLQGERSREEKGKAC